MSKFRYTAEVLDNGYLSVPEDMDLKIGEKVEVIVTVVERGEGSGPRAKMPREARKRMEERRRQLNELAAKARRDPQPCRPLRSQRVEDSVAPKQGTSLDWARPMLDRMPPKAREAFIERKKQLDELMSRSRAPKDLGQKWARYLYGSGGP